MNAQAAPEEFDVEAYQRERDARDLAILEAADAGVDVVALAAAHDKSFLREARKE